MRQLYPIAITVMLVLHCKAQAQNAPDAQLLKQVQVIALPGVEGRIDHMALDAAGGRLFIAALGNDTVEVIDLKAGKVEATIKGLRTPQGVGFASGPNRLAVANDKDGSCRLYDGQTLKHLVTVDLKDDADNVRYDEQAKRFWVGYGEGGMAAIDPVSTRQVADIKLDAHHESFQLESKGKRIFVNVAKAGHVAVVDREKSAVIAKWPLKEAAANFPMALDEANHRLFVGCRKPPKLLVLDIQTGKTVSALECVSDTDDVWYDAARKRVYVSGGGGVVSVYEQLDADHYKSLGQVETAAGARTSFFVPEAGLLYVAAPHRGADRARLLVLEAQASRE